ncbi:MAG: DUF1735 domain-containing protein [Bacteroidales bacterium]
MKKIITILFTGILLFSCTNRDIEFDDYDYTTVYFPFQMPIRTLILGDESVGDNFIDLEKAFSIGITMGGVYENQIDRIVTIAYAPELAENIVNTATGDTLMLLPESYYDAAFLDAATLEITIPSGKLSGKTRIDLNDAFFQDPLSTGLNYVIPLRIISAVSDSVLSGEVASGVSPDTADVRNPDHWKTVPKNYTLFGIRYINATHGYYLYRGQRLNLATNDTTIYSARFLTDNIATVLTTTSLTENMMGHAAGISSDDDARFILELTFDHENQDVVVAQADTTTVDVIGTGIYYTKDDPESESYNGNKHRTIYLNYIYNDGTDDYQVNDSLVFIDTDVTFEEYKVTVYKE